MPIIDHSKCDGCGLCIGVCSFQTLVLVNNIVSIVATEECSWCTLCEAACPTGAIACPFEIVIEDD